MLDISSINVDKCLFPFLKLTICFTHTHKYVFLGDAVHHQDFGGRTISDFYLSLEGYLKGRKSIKVVKESWSKPNISYC